MPPKITKPNEEIKGKTSIFSDEMKDWYKIAGKGKKDTSIKPDKNFKNHLIKPCSMISMIGSTGAGKTTALLEFLSRKNDAFHRIIIFSGSTTDEPLIKFLEKHVEGIELIDNADELPELTQDFYNDLIKYKCSSKEPQQQENNKEETEIKEAEEQFKNYEDNKNKAEFDEVDYNEFQDKEKIKELLLLLNDERAHNYNDWLTVGQILKYINTDYEDLFNDFSKRGESKYKGIKDILKHWQQFNKSNINNEQKLKIGTLYLMSKEDNPEGFHLFLKKYNKKIDEDIFINKFNHYNIAEYFFNINKNNYIYSKFKKDETFYYYNQQNILKEQAETFIYSKIKETIETKLNEIINNYKKSLEPLIKQLETTGDKIKKSELEQKIAAIQQNIKKINVNINNIGCNNFLENILKQLKNFYYIEDFENKFLNRNINIIAFNNGCYDYTTGNYRPINKGDFISITTGYNMPIDYDDYEKINKLFFSIFENDEIMDYYYNVVSSCLFGNKEESFYIFTGEGSNRKGLQNNLLEKALEENII